MAKFTYQNLLNVYLLNGVSGVEAQHEEQAIPRAVFVKAVEHLRGYNKTTEMERLERTMNRLAPFTSTGSRGRPAPTEGEERSYKVQRTNAGAFIRLPMDTLGVDKGDLVVVRFDNGEIVVCSTAPEALTEAA